MVIHIDIHPDAEIGPGLFIPHVGTIRVHGDTKMGADCSIYQGCTIGAGPHPGGATIGDHVFISNQSSIIGQVTIGDRAVVAANSLVIANVPAGMTAIGVPARILPKSNYNNYRTDPTSHRSVSDTNPSNDRSIGQFPERVKSAS